MSFYHHHEQKILGFPIRKKIDFVSRLEKLFKRRQLLQQQILGGQIIEKEELDKSLQLQTPLNGYLITMDLEYIYSRNRLTLKNILAIVLKEVDSENPKLSSFIKEFIQEDKHGKSRQEMPDLPILKVISNSSIIDEAIMILFELYESGELTRYKNSL